MAARFETSRLMMRALTVAFPEQLTQGFRIGRELDVRLPDGARSALIVGMGGSAIAADLLENTTRAETDWTIASQRGPVLPKTLPPAGVVLFVSYSGDTWETLSAYTSARRRKASCIAISSGGKLERLAQRDGVPHAALPPKVPPRAALGWILGTVFGILDPGFPESYEGRLKSAADHLERRQGEFASARGGPAKLADRIGSRTPTIITSYEFPAVAKRWVTEIEENAKRLAYADVLPEAMHNSLVAWDATGRSEARRHVAVFLDVHSRPPSELPSAAYLGTLLRGRGVAVEELSWNIRDRLEAILTAVSFGDHFSLSLAANGGVDPLEIRALELAKRAARTR